MRGLPRGAGRVYIYFKDDNVDFRVSFADNYIVARRGARVRAHVRVRACACARACVCIDGSEGVLLLQASGGASFRASDGTHGHAEPYDQARSTARMYANMVASMYANMVAGMYANMYANMSCVNGKRSEMQNCHENTADLRWAHG